MRTRLFLRCENNRPLCRKQIRLNQWPLQSLVDAKKDVTDQKSDSF